MMDGRNIAVSSHHSQLEGLRVGVVQGGDAAATRPRDADAVLSLASFATLADLVEALSEGRIDAAVHEGRASVADLAAYDCAHLVGKRRALAELAGATRRAMLD